MALKGKKRARLRRAVKGGLSRLRKPARATHEAVPHTVLEAAHMEPHAALGLHRLDPESWRLPMGLAEAGETEEQSWMPGPLVTTIIVLAVIFIVVIAVLVAQMEQPVQ